jgi:HlyD family secretion protein
MTRKNVLVALTIILLGAASVAATFWFRREKVPVVTTEVIRTRDLEAIVSASGTIQPKRLVNISADTPGRVVNLAVNEGDRVTRGQFLLQIDPKSLRSRVDNSVASMQAAKSSLAQMEQAVETERVQLEQLRMTLDRQRGLWRRQLTTREALEKAENDVKSAESSLGERERVVEVQSARIAQEQASLESARYDLSKVRIESPIDGIVTRRNIQEGETAVVGTMNNAGTVLLTLADMSVIQAELEVDETNIPSVAIGQVAKVTIDALPEKSFHGHVTEIGNSPIQQTTTTQGTAQAGTQATNFKVVVVLDDEVPEVRPGFTCTADITTATRKDVAAVPIPAVAVRELVYDERGNVVKPPRDESARRASKMPAAAAELEPGQTRKETEGVFVLRGDRAEFAPIKMGIAGERYFEVLGGVQPGEVVVTGPYNSVRGMADGDPVKVETKTKK